MGTGPKHPTEGRKFNLIDPVQTGEADRVAETMRELQEAAARNMGRTTVVESIAPTLGEQQTQPQPPAGSEHEVSQLTSVGQ